MRVEGFLAALTTANQDGRVILSRQGNPGRSQPGARGPAQEGSLNTHPGSSLGQDEERGGDPWPPGTCAGGGVVRRAAEVLGRWVVSHGIREAVRPRG